MRPSRGMGAIEKSKMPKGMAKGGAVRRDGCASKGKTKGRVC